MIISIGKKMSLKLLNNILKIRVENIKKVIVKLLFRFKC